MDIGTAKPTPADRAAASPHTDAAFLEASRAVGEVLERRAYPFLTTKPGGTTSSAVRGVAD